MPAIVGYQPLALAAPAYPTFPLRASPNGRYLVDNVGRPFRFHGYSLFPLAVIASVGDLRSLFAALVADGVTAIYMSGMVNGDGATLRDGLTSSWPFLKDTTGATYAGTTLADVSTPNPTYWGTIDTILATALQYNLLVGFFPGYLGYQGGNQGFAQDFLASGSTKVTSFGNFIGARYKNQPNLIWGAFGDCDPTSITGLNAIELAFVQAVIAGGAAQPWMGHLPNGNGNPYNNASVSPYLSIASTYVWTVDGSNLDSTMYTGPLAAAGQSPAVVAGFFDNPWYETEPGPPFNQGYAGDLQPTNTRKRCWWGLLSGTWGTSFGNYTVSDIGNGTPTYAAMNVAAGLGSDGHKHFKILGQIMNSIPWWELLPATIGPIGTLITSGGGTSGNQNFVTAAANPDGNLLLAYIPPAGASSITIASGAMAKKYTARWVDPTVGLDGATVIGSFSPGSQAFTTPGNNAYGAADWLLLLQG
jgi:Protein of unknown function (DUF4038)